MASMYLPTTSHTQTLQKHRPLTSVWCPESNTHQMVSPHPHHIIAVNKATLHLIHHHSLEQQRLHAALLLVGDLQPGLIPAFTT